MEDEMNSSSYDSSIDDDIHLNMSSSGEECTRTESTPGGDSLLGDVEFPFTRQEDLSLLEESDVSVYEAVDDIQGDNSFRTAEIDMTPTTAEAPPTPAPRTKILPRLPKTPVDPETATATGLYWRSMSNIDFINKSRNAYYKTFRKAEKGFESLDQSIVKKLDEMRQSDEEYLRKMQLRADLEAAIKRHRPDWEFKIFASGSTISGLATRNSDVDLCVWITQAHSTFNDEKRYSESQHQQQQQQQHEKSAGYNILRIIRHCIHHDKKFRKEFHTKDCEFIDAAIPVLKIKTIDGIELDLSVCTLDFVSGVHNSYLIAAWAHVDIRFVYLSLLVKLWAEKKKIKDPKNGRFNSYALVMLVVHFLQCGVFPPVLPNLQKVYPGHFAMSPTEFPDSLDFGRCLPKPLPDIERNTLLVPELFVLFLDYYHQFYFDKYIVSIKEAAILDRPEEVSTKQPLQAQVQIQDPIDDHNPGRTVKQILEIKTIIGATLNLFDIKYLEEFGLPDFDDLLE